MANNAQTGLNVAGGIMPMIGGGVGAAFGPAGSAIGSMAGGALGGILSMIGNLTAQTPKAVGPTGAQKSILSSSLYNINKLQSQQGMTSAQVNRMYELSGQQDLAQLQLINALDKTENMSPLAREAIAEGIIKETSQRQLDMSKQLANIDIEAESRREHTLIGATEAASGIATNVQLAMEKKQAMDDLWEQTKWTNIGKNLEGIAGIMDAGAEYLGKGDLKWAWGGTQKTKAQTLNQKVAQGSGIAGTPEMGLIGKSTGITTDMNIAKARVAEIANSGGTTIGMPTTPTTRSGSNGSEALGIGTLNTRKVPVYQSVYDYFAEVEREFGTGGTIK